MDVIRNAHEPFLDFVEPVGLLANVLYRYGHHRPSREQPAARPQSDAALRISALAFRVPAVVADDSTVGLEADRGSFSASSRSHANRPAVDAVPPRQVEIAGGVRAVRRDRGDVSSRDTRWQWHERVRVPNEHEVERSNPMLLVRDRANERRQEIPGRRRDLANGRAAEPSWSFGRDLHFRVDAVRVERVGFLKAAAARRPRRPRDPGGGLSEQWQQRA